MQDCHTRDFSIVDTVSCIPFVALNEIVFKYKIYKIEPCSPEYVDNVFYLQYVGCSDK